MNDKDYYKPISSNEQGRESRIQCLTRDSEKKVLYKIYKQFESDGRTLFPSKSLLFRSAIHSVFLYAQETDEDSLFDDYSKFRNLGDNDKKTTPSTEAFRIPDETVDQLNFIINQIYLARSYHFKLSCNSTLIKFILFVFIDKDLSITQNYESK